MPAFDPEGDASMDGVQEQFRGELIEPAEMLLLRGPLSQRATSAEFNEWQAREIVSYIDRLRARIPASITASRRDVANAINLARYGGFPGGLPPRDIEFEDSQAREYSYRLADAALALFAHTSPQGEAGPASIENEFFYDPRTGRVAGDAGDTEPGDHERGCQGREYTCTCGYDDKRDALVSSLRAERDSERAGKEYLRKELHSRRAQFESSLAAEKQRVGNQREETIRAINRAEAAEQRVAALEGALTNMPRLVVAARIVAFERQDADALRELDQASEAFAEMVPWDDAPTEGG